MIRLLPFTCSNRPLGRIFSYHWVQGLPLPKEVGNPQWETHGGFHIQLSDLHPPAFATLLGVELTVEALLHTGP